MTEKGPFFYKSPIFEVKGESDDEQEFFVLPQHVVGRYFRVRLIGKPAK